APEKGGEKPPEKAPDPPPPVVPPPSTEVDATDTVMVKLMAPANTRLIDQRDGTNLSPNTAYRWSPGRRAITYRCPKKGKQMFPDVTYNLEVKPGVTEQSFNISCK